MKQILSLLLMAFVAFSAFAQQMPQMPPLPTDPKMRVGKLPNGLTYFIYHNDLPEHNAEFYIAQKVGSVLEEDNQRGLAHFLEHMAFNGTKNFPGKNLLEYLQRHGVKFGANVNAYTSIDETVYNISDVPTDPVAHPNIVDSCLLILHDWSGYISLLDEEIDNERGVIHEEWRSSAGAQQRMLETILPKLLPDNRYNDRMPIGKKAGENHLAVVDDFKYEELRDYYKKWYRPDLQGIFVVGDVDVDAVEQKITELWSDIHVPENAAERVYFPVEDNEKPLVAVASDVEQSYNLLSVMYKSDPMPDELKLTQMGYITNLAKSIITSSLNQRLSELAQQADAPFLQVGSGFGMYLVAKTKDVFELNIIFKDNEWQKGLDAVMATALSAVKYGFTEAEVERVKADILSGTENSYNERDKRKNGNIVAEIQRHFLQAEAMPGIEMEWQMVQQILPMINAAMINQIAAQLITPNNVALMVMGQQKEGNVLPTEDELVIAYNKALEQEVQPYEEKLSGIKLLPELPAKAGKVVSEADGAFGSKVWMLDNGIKIVWKQTDFKKDQVLLASYSKGGESLEMDLPNIMRNSLGNFYDVGGLGQFKNTDLPKVLAGKNVSIGTSIGGLSETVSGSATPKDLRTLFELIYLSFTQPRYDEEAYQAWYNRWYNQEQMAEGNPNKILGDSLTLTIYPGQPEYVPLQLADFKDLDYKKGFEIAKKRFANPADFTFYFVGNIDVDSLRTFSELYLGSLPTTAEREDFGKIIMPTRGTRENRFDLPMQQPKTTVYNFFLLYDRPFSIKENLMTNILGQVAAIVFTETIREKEGGVYSPHAQASTDFITGLSEMVYLFETGAEKLEHIEDVAYTEFCRMATEGIREDAFQKVRDYLLKTHEQQLKENGYWLSNIQNLDLFNINMVDGWEEALNSITLEDLQTLMKKFVNESDRIQFIANGVAAE